MLMANDIITSAVDWLKGKAPACIHEFFEVIKILGSEIYTIV